MHDLVVCGGGPSGVMAAISAARCGLKVLLIERYGFLGGMNTAGLVGPIMTFHAGKTQIVRGIPGEIFEKLKSRGGTPGHLVDPIWGNTSMTPIDTETYKSLLLEEIQSAGVELLLHSQVLGGTLNKGVVETIQVSNKQGISHLRSKYLIDATGDGDLAAALGCEFLLGREKDMLTQPMTLMFKMGGMRGQAVREFIRQNPDEFYLGLPLEEYLASPGLAVSGFFSLVKRAKLEKRFPVPDRDRLLFFGLPRDGEVSVNTLRISGVNGTKSEDLTRAEATLRKQVGPLVQFFNQEVPGFKDAYLIETAAQVGVRETRHILGDYVLRADDIIKQRKFKDVIAHASYPIDIHSPDGSGMKITDPRKEHPETFYDIPMRCLIPRGVSNLLISGRCISAEHEASASARISATCMALGQACGVIASSCIEYSKTPRELEPSIVQKKLLEQGAFLLLN